MNAAAIAVGTAVPFSPATRHELGRDLGRLPVDLLATENAADDPPVQTAAQLGIPTVSVAALLQGDPAVGAIAAPARPETVAVILHSSGTTGLPKRIPRNHRSFLAATRTVRSSSALTPDDVALLVSGVCTNAGLRNTLFALLTGGSCVVAPRLDPARYPDWLAARRPTWTCLSATELNLILDAAANAGREAVAGPGSRLRFIRAGSQAVTPGTLARAERSLGAPVFEGYGMSEASNLAKCGPGLEDRRPGSCGRPMAASAALRILDAAGADAAPGAAGEVVVKGPAVFTGYLDNPEANAAAFTPDGWFRTGDIGYLDADGFLYLQGRLHEMIDRGGETIAPAEVDRVLQSHPAVAEAAVFGVPDARFGEEVVAAVVLRSGLGAAPRELRAWMLDRSSPSKAPRRIWVVEALPRTASGKVRRGELARRWPEAHG